MMRQLRKLVFRLERLILKGAPFQLFVIAGLIVLVSLAAGAVMTAFHAEYENFWDAAWWGFLRLSDPGYLGDDKGALARTISTIVTILGYVLFMGALIAIMTQGLHRTMARLEAGLTPITQNGHILILGYSNRTAAVIKEMLSSEERVNRFLRRIKARRLHIVVLADHVTSAMAHGLKTQLGELWDSRAVTLRSGDPLRMENLRRVDFLNASVVIIAAHDVTGNIGEDPDAHATKILLSISNAAQERIPARHPPLLVTEMTDPGKVPIAIQNYAGAAEILPSAGIISRLIAQNVRHAGLSHVYGDLLTHGQGNEIYLRECPELDGETFGSAVPRFEEAIPLGFLRTENGQWVDYLNPPHDLVLQSDDRLVFMARDYKDTYRISEKSEKKPSPRRQPVKESRISKRILLLGWSRKVPVLLEEFDSYQREDFTIDIVSLMPAKTQEKAILEAGYKYSNITLRHVEGDYTAQAGLQGVKLGRYDNVVFVANDWLDTLGQSDARTLMGYLMLKSALAQTRKKQSILVELLLADNEGMFKRQPGEVVVSPRILSHMLAHVALRPELRLVFEELFTAEGAEIYFRAPGDYFASKKPMSFSDIQHAVARRGDIALGLFRPAPEGGYEEKLYLNPGRDEIWSFEPGDEIVVLTTYE